MGLYFVTTDHLEDGLWFRDDDDYKTGMNYVAVLSFVLGIKVIAFILMSNHVHFLVICNSREEAELFINEYKKKYGKYYRHKYGVGELLRRNAIDIQEITLEEESPERIIAYILMNCVAANICLTADGYPWGSGNCYFKMRKEKGTLLGNLSSRERIRKLHSVAKLPSEWMILDDGYIAPDSYVDVAFVERLYRTPKRMNYFLMNSSKAKKTMANNENKVPSFRDQLVIASIPDLCRSLFGVCSIKELNDNQTMELIKQLKRCFYSDVNQIARVTGLSYSDVAYRLDHY